MQDAADQVSVEKDLEAGVKILDSADLDFSRYADTLFEVLFAGGRLATGGNLADEQKDKLATNVSLQPCILPPLTETQQTLIIEAFSLSIISARRVKIHAVPACQHKYEVSTMHSPHECQQQSSC